MKEFSDKNVSKNEMAHAVAKTKKIQQMIVGCLATRAGGSVIKAQGCKTDAKN